MKLKRLALGLAAALTLASVGAQAQDVLRFQDDDVDFLFNADGTAKTSGTLVVGDVLVSVFEIPSFSINGVPSLPAGQELTGLAVTQIASIAPNGSNFDVTFQPYTGGFNFFSPTDVAGGGAGEGAIVGMWLNSTADFNLLLDFANNPATNCTSYLQCATEATTGSLFQIDGFFGDADEYWTALVLGANTVEAFRAAGGATPKATFDAALVTTFNATGPIIFQDIETGAPCPAGSTAADGCIAGPHITGPVTGGAGLGAGILADGAFARSDIDAVKLSQVPEPGTLTLMGLGLIGLAFTRRRR
jgi:hypothetical protein